MNKLKTKIILLILLVLTSPKLVFSETKAGKFEPIYAVVSANQVNVRAGQGLNFEVLAQLNQGSEVVVIGEEYDWYKIKLPKQAQCFVHCDYVKDGLVLVDELRVRAGAGVNFNILAVLTKGERVAVLQKDSQWLKITPPQNASGWVKKDYLRLSTRKFISAIAQPAAAPTKSRKRKNERKPQTEAWGRVDELGKIYNRPGTHKLIGEKKILYYLKSKKIDLNQYVYKWVGVIGELITVADSPYPIIDVQRIKAGQ